MSNNSAYYDQLIEYQPVCEEEVIDVYTKGEMITAKREYNKYIRGESNYAVSFLSDVTTFPQAPKCRRIGYRVDNKGMIKNREYYMVTKNMKALYDEHHNRLATVKSILYDKLILFEILNSDVMITDLLKIVVDYYKELDYESILEWAMERQSVDDDTEEYDSD